MRRLPAFSVIGSCAAIVGHFMGGCSEVKFARPLSEDQRLEASNPLVGFWEFLHDDSSDDEASTISVLIGDSGRSVAIVTGEQWIPDFRVTKLGDHHYVSIRESAQGSYFIALCEFLGPDRFKVRTLRPEDAVKAIDAGELRGTHDGLHDVRVSDSTEALRLWVSRNHRAFRDGPHGEFQRVSLQRVADLANAEFERKNEEKDETAGATAP